MFNFTPTEKRAVITLVVVICGAGIIQLFRPLVVRSSFYDYAPADTIFQRISRKGPDINYDPGATHNNGSGPSRSAVKSLSSAAVHNDKKPPEPGSVDINRASAGELERLPHIGPALAQRIVAYRNRQGRFKSLQDLKRVKGLGEKTIRVIAPYLQELVKD
jgi:comEA protein